MSRKKPELEVVASNPELDSLGPQARAARGRPDNFFELSGERQWEIDKELGILDWDGDPKK